jgi:hypothetical protein
VATAGVLLLDHLKPGFGDPSKWVASRGTPWVETRPKEIDPNRGGNNPPEWVKNALISLGLIKLMDSLGKIDDDLAPKNWSLGPVGQQTSDFFNDVWNKTIQGINDVNNGLKTGWPGN